jgi:hypothetical protein
LLFQWRGEKNAKLVAIVCKQTLIGAENLVNAKIEEIAEQIVPEGLTAPSCQDNADEFCCSVRERKVYFVNK